MEVNHLLIYLYEKDRIFSPFIITIIIRKIIYHILKRNVRITLINHARALPHIIRAHIASKQINGFTTFIGFFLQLSYSLVLPFYRKNQNSVLDNVT